MKSRTKRFLALGTAVAMTASLAACGKSSDTKSTTAAGDASQSSTTAAAGTDAGASVDASASKRSAADITPAPETRDIKIGTWYDFYYTSDDDDINDNPDMANEDQATEMLASIRNVESKYNVTIHNVNLTYSGTIDSINTSIMAGAPDCDIYLLDQSFGIPAVLNGYAVALEDCVADDDDIWSDQNIMTSLKLTGADKTYMFAPQSGENAITGMYYLACNMDLINAAGLENPQDLWDNNEWTWDKFEEYCLALNKDTDGDGAVDQFALGGRYTNFFIQMVMANGGTIAASDTEGIDSPATIEAMDFFSKLCTVDKVTAFDVENWDPNETNYTAGNIAFWTTAQWIASGNADADLPFEIAWVPFPIGPSGNKDTNFTGVVGTKFYMMPVGVEDPCFVYNVFETWKNWYNGDTDDRDSDMSWWEDNALTDRNYQYCWEMSKNRNHLEFWDSIGVDTNYVTGLITGDLTAAQAAEQYKQLYQDALTTYFGGSN